MRVDYCPVGANTLCSVRVGEIGTASRWRSIMILGSASICIGVEYHLYTCVSPVFSMGGYRCVHAHMCGQGCDTHRSGCACLLMASVGHIGSFKLVCTQFYALD